jgi:hypothetical protein
MSNILPSNRWVSITNSDVTEYETPEIRALFVLTDGNLNLVDKLDTAIVFTGVTAGQILPMSPKKIMSTSSTATVAGLY